MKAIIAAVGLWHGRAELQARSANHADIPRAYPRQRGFADVDPETDASLRFMKNEAKEQEQEGDEENVHDDLPHVDTKDPETLQHEIERMAERMKRIGEVGATEKLADELDDIEALLENTDQTLHSEIVATREELCAERGFLGHQLDECDAFMHIACGRKSGAVTVPRHMCRHFFIAQKRDAAVKTERAVADAPAPSQSGAPGPAPGPFLFGGKIGRELPDQGFMGELGAHRDRKSKVTNWGAEYGPTSGHRTFHDICADNPNNEWCRIHGFYRRRALPRKSGATSARAGVTAALLIASFLRAFALGYA